MSYGVKVQISNQTYNPVTLKVTLLADSNWESATQNTPLQLNGVRLDPNSSTAAVHVEVANSQAVALFQVDFVRDDGVVITTVADANAAARGRLRKGRLPSYQPGDIQAFQVLEAQYAALDDSGFPNLCVALLPKIDTRTWMSRLRDDLHLFQLTIPGTHDTGADLNIIPGSRCQDLSIAEQLDAGVRFLDVRLSTDYPLQIIHGASQTEKYYRDDCCVPIAEFLKYRGPDETVLLCVGQDSAGNFHRSVLQILENTLDGYFGGKGKDHMVTDEVPGPLGSLRGKVVLLRRYDIDAASKSAGFNQPCVQLKKFESYDGSKTYDWPDNSDTFEDTGGSGNNAVVWQVGGRQPFAIQDYYSLLESKWKNKVALIEKYIDSAATNFVGTWYINFLSCTYDIVTATPREFAEGFNAINAAIYVHMMRTGRGRYGTLPTDFMSKPEGLMDLMINSNQGLLKT